MKTIHNNQKKGLAHKMDIFLSATLLKNGSVSCTINNDKEKAKRTVSNDSLKNWKINCLRNEPIVLRMPTSFARFSLRAVLRFIKLIHASNKTNTPIIPNIHTYCIAPPTFTPFLNSAYKCQWLIGSRKSVGFFFASCGLTFLSFES